MGRLCKAQAAKNAIAIAIVGGGHATLGGAGSVGAQVRLGQECCQVDCNDIAIGIEIGEGYGRSVGEAANGLGASCFATAGTADMNGVAVTGSVAAMAAVTAMTAMGTRVCPRPVGRIGRIGLPHVEI